MKQTNIVDMNYTNSDDEYQEVCQFLNTLAGKDPYMLWEAGRMNFWRYNVHAEKEPQGPFFRENVHVWRSDGQIVGLCISEYGEDDLFIEVLPEFHFIYPDIFRWINGIWSKSRKKIKIDLYDEDEKKISWLKKDGYTFLHHHANHREYHLDKIDLSYKLEEGFSIQTCAELNDIPAMVALVQSAFDNPNYNETRLKGLISSPDYITEYHLAVVSPEKQPVAYCIGWHTPSTENEGYIEPVGTHADFRRRGFAKAMIRECFQRLEANGIKIVAIASAAEPNISNFLYDSLSPQVKKKVDFYSKDAPTR